MTRLKKGGTALTAVITAILIMLVPLTTSVAVNAATTTTTKATSAKVHLMPYSEGLSVIVECNGKFGMIDACEDSDCPDGSDPRYPLRDGIVTDRNKGTEENTIRYMHSLGITEDNFEFFIGTHPHSDHIGAADEVINAIAPKRVYLQEYKDSYISNPSRLWDNLYVYDCMLNAARNAGSEIIQDINSENADFTLGDGMEIEIKNYGDDYKTTPTNDANDFSLGVLIKANGKSLFVSGDINNLDGDETRLVPQLGHVDVLVLGHHGVDGSNSYEYVTGLSPNMILNSGSFGAFSGYAFPDEPSKIETILEMANKGVPTYVTEWFNGILSAIVVNLDETITTNIPKDFECIAATNRLGLPVVMHYKNGLPSAYNGTFGGYTFNNSAWANLGTWIMGSKGWYYIDSNGNYVTGWQFIKGYWYYFDSNGWMLTGWQKINGKWYYLYPSQTIGYNGNTCPEGSMAKGWVNDCGDWYYLALDGKMKTGWNKIEDKWYYLYPERTTDDYGNTCPAGSMATKWIYLYDNWYYLYPERTTDDYGNTCPAGSMATEWAKIDGEWYYFNSSGHMQIGWLSIDGYRYYLCEVIGERGKMLTGQQQINGYNYYFYPDRTVDNNGNTWLAGSMATGWIPIGNDKYYFDADGCMVTGLYEIDSIEYKFDSNGSLIGKFGDANNDGNIDIKDATYMQIIISDIKSETDYQLALGDVDKDDILSVADVTLIQKYLSQMVTKLS